MQQYTIWMDTCQDKMKDKKLEIRITSYEMRQLEQEATRRGMTKSELVRSFIARFPAPV